MGNQGSHTHHGLPLRHRLDSDGPPVLPPHVSPAAVAVPAGRPRHTGGDQARLDTPGTFETPPCINIRPSNQTLSSPSPSPSPSPSTSSTTSTSSPSSPPAPITPHSERWQEEPSNQTGPRPRARTTNNVIMERARKTGRARQVPTVFRYCKNPRADDVYVTGTMTNWKCVKMSRPEAEWVHIHDTREGRHYYKFLVDGHWKVEDSEAKVERDDNVWNVMEVKKSDFEVFDALACDSFSLKTSERSKTEVNWRSDSWCQVSPNFDKLDVKSRNPPTLPPHLLQVILNKDVSYQPDPILLEEPSHVMLNHIYAQAIKDDLLVLSSTQRFRKKYVTTLLYKPI